MADSLVIGEANVQRSRTGDVTSSIISPTSPLLSPGDDRMSDFEINTTVTASPSADSLSSSVLASLKMEDDFCLEGRDLMVKVDNPEKHSGAMDNYITFRITTKTTRSDYDSSEYGVRRRYNDFMWLRQKLEETYSTHLVPPLPEKHSLQRLSRFNPEFIRSRMLALNKFLNRVAEHPVLSFDNSLKLFLTSKPFEFASHRKQGSGFVGRMSDSFHNLAATYMIKSRSPEFDALNDYIDKLHEKLSSIERIAQRINREQAEYAAELNECHPIFTLWSSSENPLHKALAATAVAVEKCSNAQQQLVRNFEEKYQQPLREYILYTEAIKEVLKRRDAIQIEYELTVDELNKRKQEREQLKTASQTYSLSSFLGKDPQDVKREKQVCLDKLVHLLTIQADENGDKVECANSDLKADMERWGDKKQADLKMLFSHHASHQIESHQQCLAAWEEAIAVIKETDVDNEAKLYGD